MPVDRALRLLTKEGWLPVRGMFSDWLNTLKEGNLNSQVAIKRSCSSLFEAKYNGLNEAG